MPGIPDGMELSRSVEEMSWTRVHTYSFIAFAIGLLLEGYIFGIAPVATSWYTIPKSIELLILAWPYLWLIIGIGVYGPISDAIGRKRTFYYSMTMYVIGGILLILSNSYVLVLIALAILLFAAGGEMNTIMVMAHEIFPRAHRSKAMMMLMDFVALSGVLLSAVSFLSFASTPLFSREMTGVIVLITVMALFIARYKMPESIRWLEKKGKAEEAMRQVQKYFGSEVPSSAQQAVQAAGAGQQKQVPIWFKELVITLVSFANSAGFGLLTYALAPLYFPSLLPYIFLIAGLAGFAGGFLGLAGDRLSRKWLLFISSLGVFVVTLIVWATISIWTRTLALFWALLIILNVIVQWDYMTEDTMKGELWPTGHRGKLTALARVLSIGAYIPLLYISSSFTVNQFILMNVLVWLVGLIAATAWLIWGYETGKGVSIAVASGEA